MMGGLTKLGLQLRGYDQGLCEHEGSGKCDCRSTYWEREGVSLKQMRERGASLH